MASGAPTAPAASAAVDLASLERSVLILYDPTSQSASAKAVLDQHTAFVHSIASRPDAWHSATQLFLSSNSGKVKFWCMGVLKKCIVDGRYGSLPYETRDQLRSAVVGWITKHVDDLDKEGTYLQNKVALVVAMFIRAEYPKRWASAFDDMLKLAGTDIRLTALFFRILDRVNEEVVVRLVQRPADAQATNSLIKDTMRATDVVKNLCAFFYNVTLACREKNKALTCSCLQTFAKFIPWISVDLVANDKFLPVLCDMLRDQDLRIDALACLYELVAKGMGALDKLQLIMRMRLVELLAATDVKAGDDLDYTGDISELVCITGQALLTAWNELDEVARGVTAPGATGSATVPGATVATQPQAVAALPTASRLLRTMLQKAFLLLVHSEVAVAEQVLPLVNSLAAAIRHDADATKAIIAGKTAKRADDIFSLAEIAPQLIECVAMRMRQPLEPPPDDDAEMNLGTLLKSLAVVLVNISRTAPQLTMRFFQLHFVAQIHTLPSMQWNDAELVLRLVYHFAEAHSSLITAPEMDSLVSGIHASGVSKHKNAAVLQTYFDLTVRYAAVLKAHPSLLPTILEDALGPSGIQHPESAVRYQAAYYLKRLVRSFVTDHAIAAPLCEPLLKGIQKYLLIPFPGSAEDAAALPPPQQAHIYTTVGLFVGAKWLPPAKRNEYVEGVMKPLLEQLHQGLSHIASAGAALPPDRAELLGDWIGRILGSMGAVSQGFGNTPSGSDKITQIMQDACVSAGKALQALPGHTALRTKALFLFHRSVICMAPPSLFALLKELLPLVVATATTGTARDTVVLLNQVLSHHKLAAVAVMEPVVPLVIHKLFEVMPAAGSPVGSAAALDRANLESAYMLFILCITVSGECKPLVGPSTVKHLPSILQSLIQVAGTTLDPSTIKLAFSALSQLVACFTPDPDNNGAIAAPLPAAETAMFGKFLLHTATPALFRICSSPRFDWGNAQHVAAGNECVALQCLVTRRSRGLGGAAAARHANGAAGGGAGAGAGADGGGAAAVLCPYTQHLAAVVLPGLGLDAPSSQGYASHLAAKSSSIRSVRRPFKALCLALRPLLYKQSAAPPPAPPR